MTQEITRETMEQELKGMRNRTPLRIQKSFDEYRIKSGSAGFIQLFKNGKRVQPKNIELVLRKRATR